MKTMYRTNVLEPTRISKISISDDAKPHRVVGGWIHDSWEDAHRWLLKWALEHCDDARTALDKYRDDVRSLANMTEPALDGHMGL